MTLLQIATAHVTPEGLATVFKGFFVVLFILVMYFNRDRKNKEMEKKGSNEPSA